MFHIVILLQIYKNKYENEYVCCVIFMLSELTASVSPVLSYPCIALHSVSSLILSVYLYIYK